MLVPANAVGKVLGKGGANIANIRKVCSHALNLFFFHYVAEGSNSWFERHISILSVIQRDWHALLHEDLALLFCVFLWGCLILYCTLSFSSNKIFFFPLKKKKEKKRKTYFYALS